MTVVISVYENNTEKLQFIEKANSRDVTIGPRLFLQCPLSVMQSREWFIKLWNQMIIPYMIKVAKEGYHLSH